MNRNALIAAAAIGLIGVVLLYVYMERFKSEASGGAPVGVVFAVEDIPLGASITKKMIGVRPLPQAYVEDRHVLASDVDRIVGVRVSSGVRANESVLWTDLASASGERRDLSGLVRSGMRAVTVKADASSYFGGLLRPGDRVDVLLTTQRVGEQGAEIVTLPLLQNMLVLAIGGDIGGEGGLMAHAGSSRESQITLSANPTQSQILTFAASRGQLTLDLRNPDDITVLDKLPDTTMRDIMEIERRQAASVVRRPVGPALPVPLPSVSGGR